MVHVVNNKVQYKGGKYGFRRKTAVQVFTIIDHEQNEEK